MLHECTRATVIAQAASQEGGLYQNRQDALLNVVENAHLVLCQIQLLVGSVQHAEPLIGRTAHTSYQASRP